MSGILLAADTAMLRARPVADALTVAAEVGFPAVELAQREDLLGRPNQRASSEAVRHLQATSTATGVRIASLMVCYAWASPDEGERKRSLRAWKQAISVAADLGCARLNTEFTGSPDRRQECEAAFRHSVDELVPSLEKHGVKIFVEPHPGDFIETGHEAEDRIRELPDTCFGYLYCAPHTYYLGGAPREQVAESRGVLGHVHLADTFSPRRIILNPPSPDIRAHQHLDIGQGEIPWADVFTALTDAAFEGVLTVCVFAWPERAVESLRSNLRAVMDLSRQAGLSLEGLA